MLKNSRTSSRSRRPRMEPVCYAVVGLGHITQVAVLPAFVHAKHSELTALVSSDSSKLRKFGKRYGVSHLSSYRTFPKLLDSGLIDAVYIAVPNSQHAEFAIMAAKRGIHVLCEKPMATTAKGCERMIAAADANDVKLMIAYRLHFERASLGAVEILRSGKIGDPRIFSSNFTMQVRDPKNIRLRSHLGGGTLPDIGIYCINAARALFRSEPTEVIATISSGKGQPRFSEVEEMASVIMRFPGERLATFTCSFGAADVSNYRVIGTNGDLCVEPAFEYAEGLAHHLTINGKTTTRQFKKSDQFAPEIEHFSECIRNNREPRASARDGLNDVKIIEAIYKSARTRAAVRLSKLADGDKPNMRAEKRKPPVRKPDVVRARSPSAR